MKNKKNAKAIVLSMVLAAGMLSPAGAFAQKGGMLSPGEQENRPRSLFGKEGGLYDGLNLQNFGNEVDDITLQNFGQQVVPLGSGLFFLLASGAGYAALKSRKKQPVKKVLQVRIRTALQFFMVQAMAVMTKQSAPKNSMNASRLQR